MITQEMVDAVTEWSPEVIEKMADSDFVLIPRDVTLSWRKSARNSTSNVLPEGVTADAYSMKVGELPVSSLVVMLQRSVLHAYNNEASSRVGKMRDTADKPSEFDYTKALHEYRLAWKKRAIEGFTRKRAAEPMPEFDPLTTIARELAFDHLIAWAKKRGMTDFPTRITAASLKKEYAGPGGKTVTVNGLIEMMLDEKASPRAKAIWELAAKRLEEKNAMATADDDFFNVADDDESSDDDDAEEGDDASDDDAEGDTADETPEPTRRTRRASGK